MDLPNVGVTRKFFKPSFEAPQPFRVDARSVLHIVERSESAGEKASRKRRWNVPEARNAGIAEVDALPHNGPDACKHP